MVEIFRRFLAVLFLGTVIQLLDDDIDGDVFLKEKQGKFFSNIAQNRFSYGLLFLSIAMILDTDYIFALFTSAYMVGMFHFSKQKMVLGLSAYEEIIVIILLNLILVPFKIFLHGLILIIIFQMIDDLLDYEYDMKYGYKNYVKLFGKGEVILAGIIFFVMSLMLSWMNTFIILPSGIFINYLYSRI